MVSTTAQKTAWPALLSRSRTFFIRSLDCCELLVGIIVRGFDSFGARLALDDGEDKGCVHSLTLQKQRAG